MSDVLDGPSAGSAGGPLGRRTFLAAAGAGALAAAGAGTAARAATGRPPVRVATVVLNGRVFTATTGTARAQAVAVGTDGKVLAVGSNADIRRRIGPRTVVIDADGGTVMPGIQDGHMHPLGAAAQSLNPSLGNASMTVDQFRARIQEMLDASAAQEPDGWLQVTDWNPVGLLPAGTVADKSLLDSLNTRRPIFLQGSDFHNSLANSRALALAGVDRTTPDPAGGKIVRGADGEPTGLLADDAQGLVTRVIPPHSADLVLAAQKKMAGALLAAEKASRRTRTAPGRSPGPKGGRACTGRSSCARARSGPSTSPNCPVSSAGRNNCTSAASVRAGTGGAHAPAPPPRTIAGQPGRCLWPTLLCRTVFCLREGRRSVPWY